MIPKTSVENAEFTNSRPSRKKLRKSRIFNRFNTRKLTPKQIYRISVILLGSTVMSLIILIMLTYGTIMVVTGTQYPRNYDYVLNDDFFLHVIMALVSLLVIEFTFLGGFSKHNRTSRVFRVPFMSIMLTLFWAIFHFFTPEGILLYSIIQGLLLAYSGFAGTRFFKRDSWADNPKNTFSFIEQALIPISTSGAFLFVVWKEDVWLKGDILPMIILLALVIVTLLNYRKSPQPQFRKIIGQYLLLCFLLFLWFLFINFSFLTHYLNRSNFNDSAIPLDTDFIWIFPIFAIIGGTFYLWDNVLHQINRVRQSTPQSDPPSTIQTQSSIHQTLHSDDLTNTNQIICPNCDTLLEQDALQELKVKKSVFCARCGCQISYQDLFGDEKASVLKEHQRLMEKITNLPSVNGGVEKDRRE